jgi:hypothetical protein
VEYGLGGEQPLDGHRRSLPSDYPGATSPPPRPDQSLAEQVVLDVRWSFSRPWHWLGGVAFNVVLSLLWLVAQPLTEQPRVDWALLVGSYFAVFVLADVTTTNVLGADARRVELGLLSGVSLRRLLLVKNLSLFLIVGVPTLLATACLTVVSEADHRLLVTLPGVLFPILVWLGVGNVVSVAFPVRIRRLRTRWDQRRLLWPTTRWLAHLALPYALYFAVDPVGKLPRIVVTRLLPFLPRVPVTRGVVLTVTGLVLWALGSAVAVAVGERHPPRLDR